MKNIMQLCNVVRETAYAIHVFGAASVGAKLAGLLFNLCAFLAFLGG